MKRLALAALLLAGACSPPPALRRWRASASGPAVFKKFRVVTRTASAEIRRDLSREEIARLHGGAGVTKTLGLSIIKQGMATHTRFGTASGDGMVAAWFDDVIITVSIAPVTIYIPKEYPKGSCEHKAILEHEQQHVLYAAAAAKAAAIQLESAVSAAEGMPVRESALVFKNREEAAAFLKAKLGKAVDPVFEDFEKDLAAAQAELDSQGAYDAIYRRCPGGWK